MYRISQTFDGMIRDRNVIRKIIDVSSYRHSMSYQVTHLRGSTRVTLHNLYEKCSFKSSDRCFQHRFIDAILLCLINGLAGVSHGRSIQTNKTCMNRKVAVIRIHTIQNKRNNSYTNLHEIIINFKAPIRSFNSLSHLLVTIPCL